MTSLRPDAPPGKSGAAEIARPDQFFKATRALLMNRDLTATEKILIQAVGLHDWGNGRGGGPGNVILAEACGFKPGEAGERCVRRLLSGLAARGYLRIEKAKRTRQNRTGRVLFLTPKATGDGAAGTPHDPDIKVRLKCHRPGHTGPVDPDFKVRSDPDIKVLQIDSGLIDPRTDPSSGDDDDSASLPPEKTEDVVDVQKLSEQARKTFKDGARARRVVEAIPGWLAWVEGKTSEPAGVISAAIASAMKSRPGGEVGYIRRSIENSITRAKTPSSPAPGSTPNPPDDVLAKRRAEAKATESQSSELDARWDSSPESEREDIKKYVRRTHAAETRWKPMFHAYCLAEMDRRSSAEHWLDRTAACTS